MSIAYQLLLSLFIASCATSPAQKPQESPKDPDRVLAPDKTKPDESRLDKRQLFLRRFSKQEYQVAISQGVIRDSTFTNNELDVYSFYRLDYEDLAFFLQPNTDNIAVITQDAEDQSREHAKVLRTAFKQTKPLINTLEDARNWVRWVEGFVYEADLLLRQEDALRLFQDRDRLIAGVNPFFYVEFDGRYYQLEYFTLQDNYLWQKRITISAQGEIIRWQQDQLSLERRGAF